MLKSVKWGKYKLGSLFDIQNTLSFNTNKLVKGDEYDYITRTSLNQGVLRRTGYVNKENINPAGTWSLGLLQMDFFYRNRPWYAGQFVRKIVPKIAIPDNTILFFQTLLNKQKKVLLQVLVRYVDDKFRNTTVFLPQTEDKEIDYAFIGNFVRKLEESHLGELEEERLHKLEAYLFATGLNDFHLTDNDHEVLNRFKKMHWKEFCIGDLFERVKTVKLLYNAKALPKQPTGKNTLPCLTSSFMNQGLNYYAPREGSTILNNVISIPSNSDVYRAYYQPDDFTVLSDSYAIRWKDKSVSIQPKQYLYMVACINKVTNLPIYSYKNKLGGWNVVKNKYIVLPVNDDNQPDLVVMDQLITVMQKVAIADVARFTAQRLGATRQIISRESLSNSSQDSVQGAGTIAMDKAGTIHIYDNYHEGCVALYTLRAACGYFVDGEVPEAEGWVDASGNGFTPDPKRHFAVHAKGDSMLNKIKDGDICVFEWYKAGSREGEIVLTECNEKDIDYGGMYTIKKYHSEKIVTEEGWQHTKVELKPLNNDYDVIELNEDSECRTIGIFKCVLR